MQKAGGKLLVLMFLPALVQAATIGYIGNAPNGAPVNVTADFVFGTDSLRLTLHNLTANPISVGQNLSGFAFTILGGPTSGNLLTSTSGRRTVNNDGTYNDLGPVTPTDWTQSGSTLFFTALGAPNGPAQTLLGQPNGGGLYSNAGGSITTNIPHEPFLFGPMVSEWDMSGITPNAQVVSATFFFNTTPGEGVRVPNTQAPEPGALLLAGAGLLALARLKRRG